MNNQQRAIEKLSSTEKVLRELAADALLEGEYESAAFIGELAQAIGRLVNPRSVLDGAAHSSEGVESATSENPPAPIRAMANRPACIPERECPPAAIRPRIRQGQKPGKRKGVYPRFFREGDTLVKVGWSKTRKGEYEHRAPYVVLRTFVEVLASLGSHKGRFVIEDAFPVLVNNEEVPSYQAYLCLGWLRSKNLVVQHGRQGYSLCNIGSFMEQAEQEWVKQEALEI